MRTESATETQWHPKFFGLREVFVHAQSTYRYCKYVRCLSAPTEIYSSGAVADLKALSWWQHISLFTVCLIECRNTVRTLCMLKLGAVSCRSRRSHRDKWRCCCIVAALCELYELLLLAVWCFTFLKERSRTALRTHPV